MTAKTAQPRPIPTAAQHRLELDAIALIGDQDPTTWLLLESVLRDEEKHADGLADLLEG